MIYREGTWERMGKINSQRAEDMAEMTDEERARLLVKLVCVEDI